MRRGSLAVAAMVAMVLFSGCGVLAPGSTGGSKISFDTPALRALKAAAHIANCPTTSAPATGGMPKATLPCLGGGPSVSLASLRGPMLINVWATTCFVCRDEMPELEAFARKYKGRVSVLGVDWEDQPAQALELARALGATYPMVADSNVNADPPPAIQTAFLPLTYMINASGQVVFKRGTPFTSEAQIEQAVQQYLGVRP